MNANKLPAPPMSIYTPDMQGDEKQQLQIRNNVAAGSNGKSTLPALLNRKANSSKSNSNNWKVVTPTKKGPAVGANRKNKPEQPRKRK